MIPIDSWHQDGNNLCIVGHLYAALNLNGTVFIVQVSIIKLFKYFVVHLYSLSQSTSWTCHDFSTEEKDGFSLRLSKAEGGKCLRCRRYTTEGGAELCARCLEVISSNE